MLLCGCGGGAKQPDDDAAVRTTVSRYLVAYLSGRGDEACGFYASALRASIDARGKGAGVGPCPRVLAVAQRTFLGTVPSAQRAELLRRAGEERRVTVRRTGERARARQPGRIRTSSS